MITPDRARAMMYASRVDSDARAGRRGAGPEERDEGARRCNSLGAGEGDQDARPDELPREDDGVRPEDCEKGDDVQGARRERRAHHGPQSDPWLLPDQVQEEMGRDPKPEVHETAYPRDRADCHDDPEEQEGMGPEARLEAGEGPEGGGNENRAARRPGEGGAVVDGLPRPRGEEPCEAEADSEMAEEIHRQDRLLKVP